MAVGVSRKMKVSARKRALVAGTEFLRATYWARAPQGHLKSLIKRFATRENMCRKKGKPAFPWRKRRLDAVAVYERRFERTPDIFRGRLLPRMRSYYVAGGRYVWPERGEPGRLVEVKHARLASPSAATS
jgi:hypothetical protein